MAAPRRPGKLKTGTKAATGLVFTEADSILIEPGYFQIVVNGTFDATWALVRSTDDPSSSPTWTQVEDAAAAATHTTARVLVGYEAEGAYYNVDVTIYGSGTVAARVAQTTRPY